MNVAEEFFVVLVAMALVYVLFVLARKDGAAKPPGDREVRGDGVKVKAPKRSGVKVSGHRRTRSDRHWRRLVKEYGTKDPDEVLARMRSEGEERSWAHENRVQGHREATERREAEEWLRRGARPDTKRKSVKRKRGR